MTVKCFKSPVGYFYQTHCVTIGLPKKLVVLDTHVQNFGVSRTPMTPTLAAPTVKD